MAVWNFIDGEVRASAPTAHIGAVNALVFGILNGETVLASGGSDGALLIWTTGLERLHRIEIGEPISAIEWTGANRLAAGTWRGVVQLRWPPTT